MNRKRHSTNAGIACLFATFFASGALFAAPQQTLVFIDRYDADRDYAVGNYEYGFVRQGEFDFIDRNRDGKLTEDEYVDEYEARVMARIGEQRSGQIKQTVIRFDSLDKNDDGKIAFEEFDNSSGNIFSHHDRNADGTIDSADRPAADNSGAKEPVEDSMSDEVLARLQRRIDRAQYLISIPSSHSFDGIREIYDTNSDGKITRDEFDALRNLMFKRMDATGDHWLTPAEYIDEYTQRLDAVIAAEIEKRLSGAHRRFSVMDENDDNYIAADEFSISGQRRFKRFDTDADGFVSLDDKTPAKRSTASN